LVVTGEAGIGKTVLIEYLDGWAEGFAIARTAGVQSEMELTFAGLHQLLAGMLGNLGRLPIPLRDALTTAFGISPGKTPDRFLVGLAALTLLSESAENQPLLCLVDDAQWLDRASAQALGFVARRLEAESVAIVFASRTQSDDLAGLPELALAGLPDEDAKALLASVLTVPLDGGVRDQILSETRGNPLAILELLREVTPVELAGGFGLPAGFRLSSSIEESYRRRLEALPCDTQRLLRLAAADPVGDAMLVWRAAERLGVRPQAAIPAVQDDLLEVGARVRFHHPLVRSVAYNTASVQERIDIHRALALVTDRVTDADRRAWHLSKATPGPDEEIAAELERSAERAQARGGWAAAAAFLERSVELTLEPGKLTDRALAAAQANCTAGNPRAATSLLHRTDASELTDRQRAAADLLRGQVALISGQTHDAPRLFLAAAQRLETIDARLARETYLDAVYAAMSASNLASSVGLAKVAALACRAPPAPEPARAPDVLLDSLALLVTEGYVTGVPEVARALKLFREILSEDEGVRWLFIACRCAQHLWDDETWDDLSTLQLELDRRTGALSALPLALAQRIGFHLHAGEFEQAASLVAQTDAITVATGLDWPPYGAMALAAWQGRKDVALQLTGRAARAATARGEGLGLALIEYSRSVLYNGLGRYQEALDAAAMATACPDALSFVNWGLVEVVEAASRTGKMEPAAEGLSRLQKSTRSCRTELALGVEARSRALLTNGDDAEENYREAIEHLGRTRGVMPLARTHLVYGEWLRRVGRRVDARSELRTAQKMLATIGADAFAERAARELLATGETVRKRNLESTRELTAQEAQVARLARDGLSNPEIAARLFISPRTVKYHLRKVFVKLDIRSRSQLDRVIPADPPSPGSY
jgi:DNA-binding CsgD family transcriptional regulator